MRALDAQAGESCAHGVGEVVGHGEPAERAVAQTLEINEGPEGLRSKLVALVAS